MKTEYQIFLTSWIRAPLKIGAAVPSSLSLARTIAKQVIPRKGIVVELGAGTGAITRALLETGLPESRLLVVERDANLCKLLFRKFPGIRIVHGDASRLQALLGKNALSTPVDAVVSGLPLLSMGRGLCNEVLQQSFSCMDDGGLFIQFTYGPFSPIPVSMANNLGLVAHKVTRIWRNIPPAAVWRYTRTAKVMSALPEAA